MKNEACTPQDYPQTVNQTLILVNMLANECLALHAGVQTAQQKETQQIHQQAEVQTKARILDGDAPALDIMIQQAFKAISKDTSQASLQPKTNFT